MKLFKIYCLSLLIIFLLGIYGCEKDLNYEETTFYTEDEFFNEFGRVKAFLSTIYSRIPNGFNAVGNSLLASATDDAYEVHDNYPVKIFNDGRWSSFQMPNYQLSNLYTGIRSVNRFIKEEENQTFEDIKYNDNYAQVMQQFQYYIYEARALRTFFYFELIKRYGGMPIIEDLLDEVSSNQVERNSYQEVLDYIVKEIDEVAPKLPLTYQGLPESETGRFTRGALLALKSRALLYAASPLNNTENDLVLWEEAARAAKKVIDLGQYSLESDYSNAFNNIQSKELILGKREDEDNYFERENFPIGFIGGNTGNCPTQNLVDSYVMAASGLGIYENGSGYDPKNPYLGRDPRFYASILYDGSIWKDSTIEAFVGGKNGLPLANASPTGYYLKKLLKESISLDPIRTTTQLHVWPILRFSEILLNYAEALNEVVGPYSSGGGDLTITAFEAINEVRNRAGIEGLPLGLSKKDFREIIHNERRVELAFEGHRFWDIRRWKIGNETTEIWGMEIERDGNVLNFNKILIEKRDWNDRMYLFPIPQNEIFINNKLTQNPGW